MGIAHVKPNLHPMPRTVLARVARASSIAAVIALCGCNASTDLKPGTTTAAAVATAASLTLSASPTTVPADNSANTTVTVTALSATNAALPDIEVSLGTNTGVVGAATVTTGANGTATFTFTSGSGATSLANRTATITATSGTATAQVLIQISGSTLAVFSGATGTVPDDGSSPLDVTFIAKNAQGTAVVGAAISVAASGTGGVVLTPASGTTDASGKFTTKVTGVAGSIGTATVAATAVGSTAAATVTVVAAATNFSISKTQLLVGGVPSGAPTVNPTTVAMTTADTLEVTIAAPAGTTSAKFASTVGNWAGGTGTITVPVVSGTASAVLSTTSAGVANITVMDAVTSTLSDSITVAMTAVTPYKITLQASPSVVTKSTGTTTGSATLIATVTDINGQPVGNAPVSFSILNPTGGGETVTPAIALSASSVAGGLTLGQALASFTSGSLTSSATGVQVRATVNPTVATGLAPSGNDASIVIGGTAGSVSISGATVLQEVNNATAYKLAMSVQVADANGSPAPLGTVVNLSLWPIAWSTGSGCSPDPDGPAPASGLTGGVTGTFLNEDANENLTLDSATAEDGMRKYYSSGSITTTSVTCLLIAPFTCSKGGLVTSGIVPGSGVGTLDKQLTPPNSAAGTVVSTNANDALGTVATDANGLGTFDLIYGKNNSIWTVVRVRASTLVAGTAAVGEIQFRLSPLKKDVDPDCLIPPSPYNF